MPTQIVLKANDIVIPAILNDTVAARGFKKRLSLKVSGYRSDVDYCCTAACSVFDPTETQAGWKNGDISLAGGWFAVLFDGEEGSYQYKNMMIIAHVNEEYLHLIKELPATVKFSVEIANL